MKVCYFLVFCLLEEIYYVVNGDRVILELIVNYVINCYYYVMSNEVAQIFCFYFSSYLLSMSRKCELFVEKNTSW